MNDNMLGMCLLLQLVRTLFSKFSTPAGAESPYAQNEKPKKDGQERSHGKFNYIPHAIGMLHTFDSSVVLRKRHPESEL